MKAPIHQRAEMFEAVISRSVRSLRDPIDSITLVDGRFVVRAGSRHLVLDCVWSNSISESGTPLPGGGHWIARSTEDDEDTCSLDAGSEAHPQSSRRPWPWRLFRHCSRR